MGVCLGKLHPRGQSVASLPPPSAPPPQFLSPVVPTESIKHSKANIVVPQPPLPKKPPVPSVEIAPLPNASSTRTISRDGSRPFLRSQTATSRSGKRATIGVPSGGDNSSSLPAGMSPAAAAAALLASGASSINSSAPPSADHAPPTKPRHMSVQPNFQRAGSGDRLIDGKEAVHVPLDVLLKDDRARAGFFRFLTAMTTTTVPTANNSLLPFSSCSSSSAEVSTDCRIDCVFFWLEISDLLKIPSGGSFHLGLMQDIFEVYVATHAPRRLLMVSGVERELLAQHLTDRDADRAMLAYKMLLLDVLQVVTPAFDAFVRNDSSLGFAQVTRPGTMRNVLSRLAHANGAATSDRRGQLHDVLNTPPLCRLFRAFLQDRNSVENLLFVIDALAYEDLVHAFEKEHAHSTQISTQTQTANPSEPHHEYCRRQAHKIFTKYIRFGSKAEICLSGAVKATLLRRVTEVPLSAQLFDDAVLLCCAELVQSHLDGFYQSPAYLAFQQAANAARQAAHAQGRRRLSLTALPPPPADESELDAPTLREILSGIGANYFRAFLQHLGVENTYLFYKEVEQFQLLPHGQKHYIQIKARRIFDRFVRRGGKLAIELPLAVRQDILFKLSSPTEFTFADALKYVMHWWETTQLPVFRRHPLHKEMRTAMDAATPVVSPRTATATDLKPVNDRIMTATHLTLNLGGQGDVVDVSTISLREFLELECLRTSFRHFLEKEQCVNELHFYFEIATFQQLPTSDYLTRQAKKLFHRFCDPQSREYVVVRDDLKAELEQSLCHPSPAMFRRIQDDIFTFFQSTLFPKFQQSEVYRTIQITPAQLRMARHSALGAVDAKTTDRVATESGDAPSSRDRRRRSVGSSVATLPELADEAVSVAMILKHQDTRSLFLLFAEEIFCTESIYFWLDCNEFKDIPHRDYLKLRAQKIYRKYICDRAKLQVNLESAITKEIVAALDDPTRTLFVAAQRSITKMLERDTLPKFRKSKHYPFCLQILKAALVK